ncbi:DUF2605 domain-containing protein [Synechocystis sp. CACIAM 05]|uniref:DUF2605 domain-containing protein n=1 Tax=Synechocystis sp. CACIAM 05 TaxID=1933929 RepID=UPI00138E5D98|nr:DUF2605 domain-containing protein [Synechocystis sp. CACIAM 05]QHV00092.1 hypothetical protein BWK47_08095 [Synechocystis sp. CACIAM 05]
MTNPQPDEKELLKTILEPLLGDFEHWFSRSCQLLESQRLAFFTPEQQQELLDRVRQARDEVKCTKLMFQATGEQVGVEFSVLVPWHNLVTECWQVAQRHRQMQAAR